MNMISVCAFVCVGLKKNSLFVQVVSGERISSNRMNAENFQECVNSTVCHIVEVREGGVCLIYTIYRRGR